MSSTIDDVAKLANVSKSTVSKVFNGYTDVGEKTKKKVLEAAKELDYVASLAARTLSSKSQKTIALVLNELNLSRKSTMPLEVLGGLYQYAEETNTEFVFYATTTKKQQEKSFAQFCKEHKLSGVVVQGLKITDPYYEQIENTDIPTVVIDMNIEGENVGTISVNNKKASKEAVDYLISLGHKDIAMINGSKDATVSKTREDGYKQSLIQNKLRVNDSLIKYANYHEETAYLKTIELIESKQNFTALFCASDVMAIGAMRALKDLGVKIPEDVSIIGFDDIILNEYLEPRLSSIKQDMISIGYYAGRLLDDIIDNNDESQQNNNIHAKHRLMIRESVSKNSSSL